MRKTLRRRGAGLALFLCALPLLGTLSGCLIFGRQQKEHHIEPEKLAQVKKGMSKDQVTELLGAPQEIIFSNKALDPLVEHAYVYEYEVTHYTAISLAIVNFGNMDSKKDRVLVFLDPAGNVDHVGSSLYADQSAFNFPFGK
jgi:outer membrane protein assembly factor BamE (lipoprotein component of BamABCDE complex)